MSLNRAICVGRLTKDPAIKYTPSGVAVANFTVAVDRDRKNEQGEKETDFLPCICFRQQAEFMSNYLSKGALIALEGRIQVRKWSDQNGNDRWTTEIIADSVQSLERKKTEEQAAGDAPAAGDAAEPFGEE